MQTFEQKGWLARQQAAKAKLAAHDVGSHPVADNDANRQRREMILAKEAADRAHVEQVERERAVMMVECPCCSGRGIALLSDAAKAIEALRRYDFAGWRPDADTLARLLPKAVAVNGNGERITETGAAEEAAALAEAVDTRKPARRHVVPPHLAE